MSPVSRVTDLARRCQAKARLISVHRGVNVNIGPRACRKTTRMLLYGFYECGADECGAGERRIESHDMVPRTIT